MGVDELKPGDRVRVEDPPAEGVYLHPREGRPLRAGDEIELAWVGPTFAVSYYDCRGEMRFLFRRRVARVGSYEPGDVLAEILR